MKFWHWIAIQIKNIHKTADLAVISNDKNKSKEE